MIAGLAAANVAEAQDRPTYELPAIEVNVLQTDLHQQAIDLYEFPERWGEAADLHRQAAEHLTKNDAGQFFGYSRAALLYFFAGELSAARRSMEDAAEVAAATGDVLTAANSFVDAAFIAVAEGYDGKQREFVADARQLIESEVLTQADRDMILARIDGAPAGVSSVRVALANRFGSLQALALAE
jgi:ATP/maltotriose-dependent transcriptional regulator MalT